MFDEDDITADIMNSIQSVHQSLPSLPGNKKLIICITFFFFKVVVVYINTLKTTFFKFFISTKQQRHINT